MLASMQLFAQNFTLSTQVTNVSCNGTCNGSIDLTVSGGTPPGAYSYSWSNGGTTQDMTNLCAGTYTVTVFDANGSVKTTSATITQPPPMVQILCATNVLCFGGNSGGITQTVTGGTPSYTYLWGTGSTTKNISNVSAGTYKIGRAHV